MAITPSLLKENDKVAIISTARKIGLTEVLPSIQLLSSWGLQVVVGQTIGESFNQFAGTDKQRAADLQNFLLDPDIKAIFFARGGYGSARILDMVDFSTLATTPKWLIGYSDVMAVLSHVFYKMGVEGVHGIMPINIQDRKPNPAVNSLKTILFDNKVEMTAKPHELNILGTAEGEMIGGNLSMLYSLLGSESFLSTEGKILVLEDLDEYLYHIDRMMLALKRAGKLSGLKGLIVGKFSDIHDNSVAFGMDAYQIIHSYAKELNIPVAFGLNIGHIGTENQAFIYGRKAKIIVSETQTLILQ